VNKHRQVLSSVFRYGEGEDTFNLPANPVSAIDERRELPAEGAPLTAAVRDAFMPGFTDAMWVVAFIALLFAAVIALRAPRKSEQATTKAAVVPE
jgi:hypothetical protein